MSDVTRFVEEQARRTPVTVETEVLVVGGGSAGVAAAVAAARNGADVTLVERYSYLGGLATGGLIILLLTMDDGRGQQVIGGLAQEAVDRIQARGGEWHPPAQDWGSTDEALVERSRMWGLVNGHGPHSVRYSVAYDPEEMKFAFEQMLKDAGVRLIYNAWACDPLVDGERLTGATFQSKSGRFAITADVVIDTCGDGDVFAAAGCEHETETVAPWLWFTMGGVRDVPGAAATGRCFQTIGEGHVLLPWGATERISRMVDATKPEDITFALLECRELVMDEIDRLRRDVPQFRDAYITHIADQLGVTESRRLVGEHVLTREEMDSPHDDDIAVTGHWTKYGALYHIPYGSLQAKEYRNLLTAGRSISVDHRVHHATKEIPACMATGEAAGTAAAMSLSLDAEPKQLDIAALQARLVERGAILAVGTAPGDTAG